MLKKFLVLSAILVVVYSTGSGPTQVNMKILTACFSEVVESQCSLLHQQKKLDRISKKMQRMGSMKIPHSTIVQSLHYTSLNLSRRIFRLLHVRKKASQQILFITSELQNGTHGPYPYDFK